MSVRRFVAVGSVAFCSCVVVLAQEISPVDQIPTWAAPPFWSASAKALPATLSPEVVEVIPSPPMPFVAINPCRIADTRGGSFSGQAGPPQLSVSVTRTFQVAGTVSGIPTQCGIPLTAQAVSFQFSVTGMNSSGNLIAWPEGAPPTTSVLNWNASSVAIGSGNVVGISATGTLNVQLNGLAGAMTHFILDVNGYYAPVGIVNTVNGLSGTVTLAAGSNVTITPAGNTLTFAAAGGGSGWSLTGNTGTTPGTNFLGTTDNQRLEIKVNSQRVFRLEPNAFSPNVIGGHPENNVTPGSYGATIAGGGEPSLPNRVTDTLGTVGGGNDNQAGDAAGTVDDNVAATVGGGQTNSARTAFSTVAGGLSNAVTGPSGSIGGGSQNAVTDTFGAVGGGTQNQAGDNAGTNTDKPSATVGGGNTNVASGLASTVPGGDHNTASGSYSFAAGRRAKANGDGTFVWADSTDADFTEATLNRFSVRAANGAVVVSTTSPTIVGERTGTTARVLEVRSLNMAAAGEIVSLQKHSASTANFLACVNSAGTTGQKCHIDSAGAFVAGSDFAEALPARGGKVGYEPGDVLVVSGDAAGSVERSSRRYDTRAIGVYSTRPGFIGADKNGDTRVDPDDVPVAITGIVPTKVTAENGPIRAGDLLTTSSTPGHAMKATPVSVVGVEFYPPGTILGKALQSLDGDRGVIRVLVTAR
jgi:hypothetical protein